MPCVAHSWHGLGPSTMGERLKFGPVTLQLQLPAWKAIKRIGAGSELKAKAPEWPEPPAAPAEEEEGEDAPAPKRARKGGDGKGAKGSKGDGNKGGKGNKGDKGNGKPKSKGKGK